MFVDCFSVFIVNLSNFSNIILLAAISESSISMHHILQRCLGWTKRQRQAVIAFLNRGNAHTVSSCYWTRNAVFLHNLNARDIKRPVKRLAHRSTTAAASFIFISIARHIAAAEILNFILQNSRWRNHAVCQCCCVINRLEARTWLAPSRYHVNLAPFFIIIIGATNQSSNFTSRWINDNSAGIRAAHSINMPHLLINVVFEGILHIDI